MPAAGPMRRQPRFRLRRGIHGLPAFLFRARHQRIAVRMAKSAAAATGRRVSSNDKKEGKTIGSLVKGRLKPEPPPEPEVAPTPSGSLASCRC